MSAAPTSLLAFWLGGASAPPASSAALTSLLAPWLGGASSPAATSQAAFTSLLGLWLGGASSPKTSPPPPTPRRPGHTWRTRVVRYRSRDRRWPRSTEY